MNDASPYQRYWPTYALTAITVTAVLTCLIFTVYLMLPMLATEYLPTRQIQGLGFADFNGRITRIGLHQAAAGPFLFGHADNPAISIQTVEFDYSPLELPQKKIRCIRINAMRINAEVGSDGIALPGVDMGIPAKRVPAGQTPSIEVPPHPEVTIEKIEIRSGMINVVWHGVTYRIPFEADINFKVPGLANLVAHVRLYPGDQPLLLRVRIDPENRGIELNLVGSAISLDRFAALFHQVPGLDITGKLSLTAAVRLQKAPFAISATRIDIAWHSGRLSYGPATITPQAEDALSVFSAVSANLKTWEVSATGMALKAPVPVLSEALTATVDLDKGAWTVAGEADVTIQPFLIRHPWSVGLNNRFSLPLALEISRNTAGDLNAAVSTIERNRSGPPGGPDFVAGGVRVYSGRPRFNLAARGDRLEKSVRWQMDVNDMRVKVADMDFFLPLVHGKGELKLDEQTRVPAWTGHTRIQVPAPTIKGGGLTGNLEDLVLSANYKRQGGLAPVVNGRLRLSNGRLQHGPSGFEVSGTRMDLPYRSTPKAGDGKGSFRIGRIVHNHLALGKIDGRVIQDENAFRFTATHTSDQFPKMAAAIGGSVNTGGTSFPYAAFTIDLPSYALPTGMDLGDWMPAMQGVTLSGTLSAKAETSLSSKGVRGKLDLGLKNGLLRMPAKRIMVEGINTDLHFPELPRIRSAPAQTLRFNRAAMGDIVADGGIFDFQVESKNTLLVEKGRLFWCGGRVDAQSLRVTAGKQDYQVSLYCQRLGLSQILKQLGAVDARGSGTVNGRIPIEYRNGRLRFDDGFLFSTPGESGKIQLAGTDILTRGIPAGTPQFAQVDLAREALKDYAYEWAKLGMVSEGEDFILRLQFDGKPVNPLPFVYKKEIGSFVRIDAGAQGSIFQGIALDVNLRLPLNRLLQYKDIVNMID